MKSDSMEKLTFGTDGWRDLIADKFTVSNLERAAQGYADALIATGGTYALVGHDTRFMSRDFAFIVANVLLANGLKVQVSEDYLPTPALSFATRHYGADGAVMLTASHNPYRFQGFKLKSQYGGSASQEFYRNVATHVNHIATGEVKRTSAQVSLFDIRDEYYKWLKSLVDVPLLQGAAGTLMHDAMGGAAAGWLTGWFDFAGIPHMVSEFRARPDPMFYGVNPEPIAPNLIAAQEMAREHAPLFIAATDGDGDRLGVIL